MKRLGAKPGPLPLAGYRLALLLAILSLSCASGRWPDRERWGTALRRAARSPATWAPAAAAAVVGAGGWDERISRWAVEEKPLFGSVDGANTAADALGVAVHLGMVATALKVPAEENQWRLRFDRLLSEEAAAVATAALTQGIKRATGRTRPNGANDRSFPSGQGSQAFASAALIGRNLRLLPLSPRARRGWTVAATVAAAGVGWGRVEAGGHYPSDVLAGAALGNFLAVWLHDAFFDDPRSPAVVVQLEADRRSVLVRLRR